LLKTKVIGIVVIALVFSIGIGTMFYFMESKSVIDSSELPPFEPEVFNIAVVGDIGVRLESERTLRNIALADPEVILIAGDLGYTSAEKWFNFSDYLGKERIHIALGNHELDYGEEKEYLRHYGEENEFYSFNYENVHFVALSTETDYSQDSEQFNFLENDLRSASVDPDIDWIIVWFHRPMYVGTTGGATPEVVFRSSMQPLFDKYDVDLVLQGHKHSYERNKPLQFNSIITDDATHAYIDPPGQIYVTVGTGGAGHSVYGFRNYEWTIIQNNEDFGFLDIKITAYGKQILAKFKTNSGEIRDFFQICLPGKDLTGVDISRIDLSGMYLACANLASTRIVPVRSFPDKSTPVRIVLVRSFPDKSTPVRFACARFAPTRIVPVKSLPDKSTPARFAHVKSFPDKSILEMSTPVRSSPGKHIWKKSRISPELVLNLARICLPLAVNFISRNPKSF